MVVDKYCCYCKRTLTIDDFHKDKSRPDGLCHRCKECNKRNAAEHRKKYPNRRRRYELKYYYGITEDEYGALHKRQDGVCAICGMRPEKYLAVDHDHDTGHIRGLLCRTCNSAIGLLKNDPVLLVNAYNYLEGTEHGHVK